MNVIYFKNGHIVAEDKTLFETSYMNVNGEITYITGLTKLSSTDDINQLRLEFLKRDLYYFNYDNETFEYYFILKSYHDHIKQYNIDKLMFDMDAIDDIYIHVFEDYLQHYYELKIVKTVVNGDERCYLGEKMENNFKTLTDYISLIKKPIIEFIFTFMNCNRFKLKFDNNKFIIT